MVLDIYDASTARVQIYEVQLYGTPDYDSRTYIYDNGVEVMEIESKVTDTSQKTEKRSDSLYMYHTGSNSGAGFVLSNTTNFTNNKIVRVKLANGEHYDSGNNSEYVCIYVSGDKVIGNSTSQMASRWSRAHMMHDNVVCDVNNVNGEYYTSVTTHTGSAFTRYTEVASWWLE